MRRPKGDILAYGKGAADPSLAENRRGGAEKTKL